MKNIWIFNQYNMPPELGHLNRHYFLADSLKKIGYKPVVFVGSKLHNSNIQMIKGREQFLKYGPVNFDYIFIKTCNYEGSKFKRLIAMFEYYYRTIKVSTQFEKPDVILGSSAHPLAAIAAIKLSKKYKCKCIVEVRDLWPESFVSYGLVKPSNRLLKLLYWGEKWIYRNADEVIFTMEGGKDYILEKGWDKEIDMGCIHHINNGIDLNRFNDNKINYQVQDEDLLKKDTFKVVYCGSIRRANKHLWMLLEAAKKIENYIGRNKIVFLFYGKGDEENKLIQYCNENSINSIKFKGYVDKKYIPYILSQSNLNVLNCRPSDILKYGGSQNKLFDYLASGKPILTGETNKYNLVRKYKCGISEMFNNSDDLANAIIKLYEMPESERIKMGDKALEVANKYDFLCLANQLDKIINKA